MDENLFASTSRDAGNVGEPPRKRVKYSVQELAEEIKLLNSKVIAGFINCNNAVITIENQNIDLLNITSELVSKIPFDKSLNGDKENQNTTNKTISKPLEKGLENVNSHFLNFLGQSITVKHLAENHQAIPHKLVIYQENDFRSPRENIQEEDLNKFLIVVCPTDCEGGHVRFPQSKTIFTEKSGKVLSYTIFEKNTHYEVSTVTRGLRALIIYKIFENRISFGEENLTSTDTERLKNIIQNIKNKNVLITLPKDSVLKKMFKNSPHIKVYSNKEYPEEVYDEFEYYESDLHGFEYLKFKDVIEELNAKKYLVGAHIKLGQPKKSYLELTKQNKYANWRDWGSGRDYQVSYYSFTLINPSLEYDPSEEQSSSSSD